MQARYLLDTNICIYVQRQSPPKVLARFERLTPGQAAISVVTWGELSYGAAKSKRRAHVQAMLSEFASLVPVLPMSAEVGVAYGELRTMLEAKGRPIGNNDLWIAAHAKALGLVLVSNNLREFERVPGLKLENWA